MKSLLQGERQTVANEHSNNNIQSAKRTDYMQLNTAIWRRLGVNASGGDDKQEDSSSLLVLVLILSFQQPSGSHLNFHHF